MSRLTKLEPRWRKKGRRGVSPIIATILLVAITVVLAAVLYILISGLTGGSSSKPYTVGFGQGQPSTNGTATYETFSLSVTNDLNTGLFALKISTPSGPVLRAQLLAPTVSAAASLTAVTPLWTAKCTATAAQGWYAAIVSPNGVIFATYNGLTSSLGDPVDQPPGAERLVLGGRCRGLERRPGRSGQLALGLRNGVELRQWQHRDVTFQFLEPASRSPRTVPKPFPPSLFFWKRGSPVEIGLRRIERRRPSFRIDRRRSWQARYRAVGRYRPLPIG